MVRANMEPRRERDAGTPVERAVWRAEIIHARVPGTVTERTREIPFGRELTLGNLSFHVSTTEIKGQSKKCAIRLARPLGHGQVPLINYELGADNKIRIDTEGWNMLEHDAAAESLPTSDSQVIADWQVVSLLHRIKLVAKNAWPAGISLPDPDSFPVDVNNQTEHSDWARELFRDVVEKVEKTSSSQFSIWRDKERRRELTTEVVRSSTGTSTQVRYSEDGNRHWHFETASPDTDENEAGLDAMEQSARNILNRDFVTRARALPRRVLDLVR